MDPDCSTEALMASYQQGDLGAATVLVHRLSPQLRGVFVALSLSREHADDLLQETWLQIHRVRHTYQSGRPVLPWLYAIARHVHVDHQRRAIRAGARERGLDEAAEIAQASEPEAGKTRDLEGILATLPESQREVITMLKVAGMSLEEVARATSSSVGSVKQKAHRAYERLRQQLSAIGMRGARQGDPS
jgi:RNA polymerase sigma-70 factor (ECF subfamily)